MLITLQYVVYCLEQLHVLPKCYYCRQSSKEAAPTVECVVCLNKIIYPVAYRPENMNEFRCYACTGGRKTILDLETNPNKLSAENGTDWLLRNQDNKIPEPFNKQSLFHTISAAGTENFCALVSFFPDAVRRRLQLHGKVVHNSLGVIRELESWVSRQQAEIGTCSLCFSEFRKSDLHLACGRSGCEQPVCRRCLEGWYGLNTAGRIINVAALSCPFCRRTAAERLVAKYGTGIHKVGNLQNAIKESTTWIYAWCSLCGNAKQYLERGCAAGAPAQLNNFRCIDCFIPKSTRKTRNCPGCGVPTEKISGCNHISCTCGQLWCWHCGEKSTEDEIDDHLEYEEDEEDEEGE